MADKEYIDKIHSIGVLRSNRRNAKKVTIKDRNGSNQTEHWDGHVDANINLSPIHLRLASTPPQVSTGGEE